MQAIDSSNKSEIEKLKEDIANQKGELSLQKARLTKFKRAIIILFFSLITLVFVLISIEAWSQIKIILTSVTGLGGLWGFISLMINIYKMTK